MSMSPWVTHPSYKQGYARNAFESSNPGLWNGLASLWVPGLGSTGLQLFDVSPNQFHGDVLGMTAAEAWANPGTMTFDNRVDRVEVTTNVPAGLLTSKYTLVMRLKINRTVGSSRIYLAGNTIGDWQMQWVVSTGKLRLGLKSIEGYEWSPVVSVDTWFDLVVTVDGKEFALYLDGVYADTVTTTNLPQSDPLHCIGGQYGTDWTGLDGEVEMCGLYSRKLAPQEIQTFAQRPLAPLELVSRYFPTSVAAPSILNAGIDQNLPAIAQESVSQVTIQCGIDQGLPAVAQESTGQVTVQCGIDQSLPAIAQEAVGGEIRNLDADQSLSTINQEVAAKVIIQAGIIQSLPTMTQIGIGRHLTTVNVEQSVPVVKQEATAIIAIQSGIDQNLPTPSEELTGEVHLVANIDQSLSTIGQDISCGVVIQAGIAHTLNSLQQEAVSRTTFHDITAGPTFIMNIERNRNTNVNINRSTDFTVEITRNKETGIEF